MTAGAQLELPIEEFVRPQAEAGLTHLERFERFHASNPWIYRTYEALISAEVASGKTRIGIGMLTEVIRWPYGRRSPMSSDAFALNNNHRAFYARLLVAEHPEWVGLFELREQRAA